MREARSMMPVCCGVLGQTSGEFAAGAGVGRPAALERYARVFRQGALGGGAGACPPVQRVVVSASPEGAVVKFTQRVPKVVRDQPGLGGLPQLAHESEGYETESVLIPMVGRSRRRSYTLCVSSQVGCAMGCGFCQTAQMGLLRSLTAAEIVAQWFAARHGLLRPVAGAVALPPEAAAATAQLDAEAEITNIVFMGMGEPMDNLDAVIAAIGVLTDSRGPAIAMSRITVSTVGRIDGIHRLARQVRTPGWHRLGLAVSVNASRDATRSTLMPINRAMPLAALREALAQWPIYGGAHQCLEYVLIPGVNDGPADADAMASFVLGERFDAGDAAADTPRYPGQPLVAMVNVIPYNPRDGSPWPAPEESTVVGFMERLKSRGVYVKRRRTKGRDTMAACGQLGNPAMSKRPRRGTTAQPVA